MKLILIALSCVLSLSAIAKDKKNAGRKPATIYNKNISYQLAPEYPGQGTLYKIIEGANVCYAIERADGTSISCLK